MARNGDVPVAVITGASAGIGRAAAKMLAARGWHVIAHGRDHGRAALAEENIRASAASGALVDIIRGDLALLADTARLAQEITAITDRVDVLLNNAGGVRDRMIVTSEGNEATFAGNHLGHFLLTRRLLPLLRRTATIRADGIARVISVSSDGHEYCPGLDWNDLQSMTNWQTGPAYCTAKLCNILFTRELARREGRNGIIANAMHPGQVDSNFASHAVPEMQAYMASIPLAPPEVSAEALVWLATSPEASQVSGAYFERETQISASPAAGDEAAASRLWAESERLVAQAGITIER